VKELEQLTAAAKAGLNADISLYRELRPDP
jgi:hypothetical protein